MGIIFSSSNGLEPKAPLLRFPGFTCYWKAEKLLDFTSRIMRKNSNKETELPLTISSKDGLVDQVTFFNKKISSKDMSGYYLLKKGEFAYNKSYSNGYDFGSIKRLERYEMGALSSLYICFSLKKHCSDYIKHYFESLKWYRQIYIISAEGARNHGLLNVPTDDFFATRHFLSQNIEEQQKIADFLSLVDLRIEKQRQLVESLKKYKRGLLKSIFKGKTANRILQDCINIGKAGGTPDSANSSYYNGTIPFLSISDMTVQGKYLNSTEKQITREGLDNSSAWLVPPKSLIISMYASYGLVAINNIALSTSQAMFNIIPKNEYLYYYLTYLAFTGYYHKMVSTGTQPNLNANKIRNIPIYMPSDTEKQNITKLLTEVDNKVNAELQYLLLLIQTKKAFLQQMFI